MHGLHWRPPFRILLLGLLALWAGPAPAQAPPWYQIELLVFLHQGPDPTDEVPPGDPGAPLTEGSLPLSPGGLYPPLPEDQLRLVSQWQRLARSRDYRPLLRLGWRQPALEEAQADRLSFQHPADGAPEPPALVGMVQVGRAPDGRLVAKLDLLYREHSTQGAPETDIGSLTHPPRYRLQERRVLAGGELHYLDHPRLGVLLQATRLDGGSEPEPPQVDPNGVGMD